LAGFEVVSTILNFNRNFFLLSARSAKEHDKGLAGLLVIMHSQT
jgi:hypothetical protein